MDRELGYVETQDYVFVPRCAVREGEEMLSAARDLVEQNVDVVVVGSNELAEAFKKATTTVPVCPTPWAKASWRASRARGAT